MLKGLRYVPRVMVTDKLANYGVACRGLLPSVEHRRFEVSEQPGRELPRNITPLPTPPAAPYRHEMDTRFTTWNEVVGLTAAWPRPPNNHIMGPMTARRT
jgi:transposase-like protein